MSEVTASTSTSAAPSSTSAAPAATKVETQVTNQAETTQSNVQSQQNNQMTNDVAVTKETPKEAPKPTESASKLDYNEMISKAIDGSISKEDYAAIEKAGLSKEQFGMMADAQKAIQLKNNDTLYNVVGGKDKYEAMKSFAAEHLGEEEIEGFNQALRSGNMKIAEIAVLGLKALHERENGRKPNLRLSEDGVGSEAISAYQTQQELIKDLNSRKYRTDSEFKKLVDARRNKSGF